MKIKNLIKSYKSNGIQEVLHKIISKIYLKEYLYKVEITNGYSYTNNKFRLSELNLQILNEMMSNYPGEIDECKYNILKERLKKPDENTYVVFENEEICGYFNIAYKDTKESCANVIINISKDSIYLYDDYTFIKHRGKGVHKFSILSRINMGINKKKKYAYVAIVFENIISEKSYEKFSFKKVKKYHCFKIGKIKKTFEKGDKNEHFYL